MGHVTQEALPGEARELGDPGIAPERVAGGEDQAGVTGLEVRHLAGALERVRQRLLTQDVLAGLGEGDRDLPMQGVADDDRHDVDLGILHDLLPGAVGLLIPVTPGRILGEGGVGVRDGPQAHRRQAEVVDSAGLPPGVGVGLPRHAGADDGHGELLDGHGVLSSGAGGGPGGRGESEPSTEA